MNSSDAKKPKFDGDWWKKNKAKEADPTNKLQTALNAYEKARDNFFKEAKQSGSSRVEDVVKTLTAVKKEAAAEKASKKLGIGQRETLEALGNYVKIADAALNDLKRLDTAPILKKGEVPMLVEKAPQFKEYCNKHYQSESFNFLSLMYKKPQLEKKWYDAFIRSNAKFEINIPSDIKKKFDAVAAEVEKGTKPDNAATWKAAPWPAAVKSIEGMLDNDCCVRFRSYMTGEMMKGHLP